MKIVTADSIAQRIGPNVLCYGRPGMGKTPLAATAPKPLVMLTEKGALSLRGSNVAAVECYTYDLICDFLKFISSSSEMTKYETVCIDSISELAEIVVERELKKHSHGMQAYGAMADFVRKAVGQLKGLSKNVYVTAKLDVQKENEISVRAPYMPGKALGFVVPYEFDVMVYYGEITDARTNYKPLKCLQVMPDVTTVTRDRSGRLAELEKPDLTYLFNKINNPKASK